MTDSDLQATVRDSEIAENDRRSADSSSPSQPLDLIGQTLDGRYYVEQKLSSGGIGDLYLASDKPELMSRRVVVKVLQERVLEDKWIVTKFRQEVEALTRINDPGVVGLLDAGTLPNGHPFLVMQFVEGDNLRSVMRPDGGMAFEDVADIWQQVGRTLSAAHECDVIHRDLKPENIMVHKRSDGSWQVKIIDFGIARIRNSLVASSTVTARLAGTANYMSPEQVDGRKASAASDIYALGVIAYEMLTGRRPFNPETNFQLSELQKNRPLSPRVLRPGVPVGAEVAILKALSYRPVDRYQRAHDFGDSLARALIDQDGSIPGAWRRGAAGDIEAAVISPNPASIPTMMATVQSAAPENRVEGRERSLPSTLVSLKQPEMAAFGDHYSATPKRKGWSWFALVFAALFIMGIAGISVWKLWFKPLGPERSLTYWLTVQRMYDGKEIGQPFDATGRDYFHTGDRFVLNAVANEAGALYLVEEGLDEKGTTEWNILFPTSENNQDQSVIAPRQQIKTGWYRFVGGTGIEQVWVVWSAQRNTVLDSIFQSAVKDGVIHDPSHQAKLRDFLKQYESSPTELIQDEKNARAMLKGHAQILIRRLDFSHKRNS
ncbi:MAG TPA: serine/threonine-protein kinase [Pyrinomonadaceae bacterium]|jgi:serine/threonine protein kinase